MISVIQLTLARCWLLIFTFAIATQRMFIKTEALHSSDLIIIGFEFILLFILWFIVFLRIFVEDLIDNFL